MIRRGFWLVAGAVLGVAAYRRAARLGTSITSSAGTPRTLAPRSLTPGGRATGARGAIEARGASEARPRVPLSHRVRAAGSFGRDVREGMAEYRDLHRRQLGRRLDDRSAEPRDRAAAGRGSIEP